MKKRLYILGMTAIMMAACSSGDSLLTQDVQPVDEENLTREELMGDVPIEFADVNLGPEVTVEETSLASRRVSLNDVFTTEKGSVGIFCLSSQKIGAAVSDDAILRSWSGNVGAKLNVLNLWQDNVKAHVASVSGIEGKILWDDINTPHYYPKVEYFNYSFAAYYPYTKVIKREKSIIYAYIPMDGDDDVIYAFANAPRANVNSTVDALAYGNSYFKGVIDAGATISDDNKPYFNFKHLTAKLNFTVQLKEASASDHQFHVDSICILNVVNIIRLSIAKNTAGYAEAGSYSLVSSITDLPDSLKTKLGDYDGHGTFWLRDTDGKSISEKKLDNGDYKYLVNTYEKTPIGDCIMIPPTSAATLKVQVYLRDEDGNLYTPSSPISLPLPTGATKWEAGKSYTVNIRMSPPAYYTEAHGKIDDWEVDTTEFEIEDE